MTKSIIYNLNSQLKDLDRTCVKGLRGQKQQSLKKKKMKIKILNETFLEYLLRF